MVENDGSEAGDEDGGDEEAFSSLRRFWNSASACSSRVRARTLLGGAAGGEVGAVWIAASFVTASLGISLVSLSLCGASLHIHPIFPFALHPMELLQCPALMSWKLQTWHAEIDRDTAGTTSQARFPNEARETCLPAIVIFVKSWLSTEVQLCRC